MNWIRLTISILLIGIACSLVTRRIQAQEEPASDQIPDTPEARRKLINEYESNKESFPETRLLAVAISCAEEQKYDLAKTIYEQFLQTHPSDQRALRGVGLIYFLQTKYDDAIKYLDKSWSLGDRKSLAPLAASYLRVGKSSQMAYLVPDMLKNKEGDFEIVNCLLSYALSKDPPDAKLVFKALADLPDQDILQREDTTQLISEVLARFGRSPGLELAQLPILRKVIRGFEADSQKWPANRRSQVADCYGLVGEYAKAEVIYHEVLKESPNDVPSLRGLGIALAYQHKFKEGIIPSRKAWSLGDKLSLSSLTACYLGARDYDGMKDLIAPLLERKKEDTESLNAVIAYAITKPSPDRELFFKAIDGFTDDQILRNEEVTHNTILGLKRFGEKERAEHLQKLKAEQDKGKRA